MNTDRWLHHWTTIADALLAYRKTPAGRAHSAALDTKLRLYADGLADPSESAAIHFVREQLLVHDNNGGQVETGGTFFDPRAGSWQQNQWVVRVPRNDTAVFTPQKVSKAAEAEPYTLELAALWLHRWTAIADALVRHSRSMQLNLGTTKLHLHSTLVNEANQLRVTRYIAEQLRVHGEEQAPPLFTNGGQLMKPLAASAVPGHYPTQAPPREQWLRDPNLPRKEQIWGPDGFELEFGQQLDLVHARIRAHDAQVLAAAPAAVRQAAAAAAAAADAAAASRAARQDAARLAAADAAAAATSQATRLAAWQAAAVATPSFPVQPQKWFHFGAPQSNAVHAPVLMQDAAARQAAARAALGQRPMPQQYRS
jgi:hypothetical protein